MLVRLYHAIGHHKTILINRKTCGIEQTSIIIVQYAAVSKRIPHRHDDTVHSRKANTLTMNVCVFCMK